MPWVMLRGLAREMRHWGDFPRRFQTALGEEVIRLDLPGMGASAHRGPSPWSVPSIVDDVRGQMCRGGYLPLNEAMAPYSLCAVSLGGMVALDWAARFPAEIARVVVINTSAGDLSRPWERFSLRQLGRAASTRFLRPKERERAILAMTSNSTSIDLDVLATEHADFDTAYVPASGSVFRQLVAAMRSRAPPSLAVPLLVLASRADRLVSHRCSERIARKLGAPLCLHDWAGHDLPLDDPGWIIDQVKGWLADEAAAGAASSSSR